MIAYKVVHKELRYGSNITGYIAGTYDAIKEVEELIPEAYRPIYTKGAKIVAPKNSVGICCFKELLYAEKFMKRYLSLSTFGTIIRCLIVPRTDQLRPIYQGCMGVIRFSKIISGKSSRYKSVPPRGTIYADSIEVLE